MCSCLLVFFLQLVMTAKLVPIWEGPSFGIGTMHDGCGCSSFSVAQSLWFAKMAAITAKQRLQELFSKYDSNGDGTLTEEEVMPLFIAFGMNHGQLKRLLHDCDKNKDGIIQVHEFIAWLTEEKPQVHFNKSPLSGFSMETQFTVKILNTTKKTKKFHIYFKKCEDTMNFPAGNPAIYTLGPGELMEEKLVMTVKQLPCNYSWSWNARSAFTGKKDDTSTAFIDPDFPHDDSSIGCSATKFRCDKAEKWIRARMLGDPTEAVLFDQVKPQDIDQGGLGDCWLMAALACMAEYPTKLKNLFDSRHLSEDGKYKIWLYDLAKNEWAPVVIDEFIPCKIVNGEPKPCFASPLGEELWVVLLEKAFAKWCGTYGMLSGGHSAWAFQTLTGEARPISWRRVEKTGNWRPRYLNRKAQLKVGARNPRSGRWCTRKSDKEYTVEELFPIMKNHLDWGFILSASIPGDPKHTEEAKGNGLYTLHCGLDLSEGTFLRKGQTRSRLSIPSSEVMLLDLMLD